MITTTLNDRYTPATGWAHFLSYQEYTVDAFGLNREPECVSRSIRGSRCRSKDQVLQEWADSLQFPCYFGHNWDAFHECIRDLEWLPAVGYMLYITNINVLLPNKEELAAFLSILHDTACFWKADRDFLKNQ